MQSPRNTECEANGEHEASGGRSSDPLITVALSTSIAAPADTVWRALADPAARARWDERILGEVALSRKPKRRPSRPEHAGLLSAPVKRTRWRFRLGNIPLVMQDDLLRADRHDRLVSHVSIGSMQFDQTLTCYPDDDDTGPHTRLGMKLVARNSIAVIGELIPRLDVQKLVIEYVDTTLRQVQKYCEN